jgi:hypothetical protein
MNTVNQTFNWKRFVAVLRKEVVENWRTLLFSIIAIYGILAIIMIIGNLTLQNSTARSEVMLRYTFVYLVFSFSGIFFASLAFRGLKSKTGRTELLTSPSSTFEKFLVNATIYVLGFIIVFPICAQLADLTRIAVLWPWLGSESVPGPINYLTTIHNFAFQQDFWSLEVNSWLEASLWIGMLAAPGLYFMGSILWPKLSFLKTFAAVYVIETVISIVAMICVLVFSDMKSFGLWVLDLFNGGNVMMMLAIFTAIQLVIYWALSWYLFKRKDVVSLKWWK